MELSHVDRHGEPARRSFVEHHKLLAHLRLVEVIMWVTFLFARAVEGRPCARGWLFCGVEAIRDGIVDMPGAGSNCT